MICPLCFIRYAPFPKKDFKVTKNKIVVKNGAAEKRRVKIYYSNKIKSCGCDKEGG